MTYSVSDSVGAIDSSEDLKRAPRTWHHCQLLLEDLWLGSYLFPMLLSYCDGSVFCSLLCHGVITRDTDVRSRGFSNGSRVYCSRALSKSGKDMVKAFRI